MRTQRVFHCLFVRVYAVLLRVCAWHSGSAVAHCHVCLLPVGAARDVARGNQAENAQFLCGGKAGGVFGERNHHFLMFIALLLCAVWRSLLSVVCGAGVHCADCRRHATRLSRAHGRSHVHPDELCWYVIAKRWKNSLCLLAVLVLSILFSPLIANKFFELNGSKASLLAGGMGSSASYQAL